MEPVVQHPVCMQCASEIRTGAKIYLAPCHKGNVLCRGCFIAAFSLGNCLLRHTAVLGEREEGGSHVTGRFQGDVWHAKCFVCDGCKTPLIKADHVLLSSGNPSCLDGTSILDEEKISSANRILYPRPGSIPRLPMVNSTHCSSASSTAKKIAVQTKRQAMIELVATTERGRLTRVGRFSGVDICPGCDRKAGPIKLATINGPLGRRWRQSCLRCGHGTTKRCSKLLDSSASLSESVAFCKINASFVNRPSCSIHSHCICP
ncbi:hypothetical protein DB88DRAFT_472168 [Papiliotrema laurentii]|uniref:LIM zinc-binding domain-containing protein n=1 Tax=Papiliotrema laurentii TaxID=5418 RepID=A0AAD9FRG2_PAPLA|nr:hypothetical protein DB88DRAFT_472168 [Papiliotrema laurentii]